MKRHILGLTAAMVGLAASSLNTSEIVGKLRNEIAPINWWRNKSTKLGRRKNRVSQASLKRAAKKRNNMRRRSAK